MNIALILSGGTGTRLGGDIPKQYIEVGGKAIIAYCLQILMAMPQIDRVQVVADEAWRGFISEQVEATCLIKKPLDFSSPGETRQLSILNGLRDINSFAAETDKVIIHDAARPLVAKTTITNILTKLDSHQGVMPVLPMKDTVYLGQNGRIESLLPRAQVLAGQAPEGFILGEYMTACEALLPDKIYEINGSTEPALLAGLDVVYIDGDEGCFKITTAADLDRFRQIVEG